MIWTSSTRRGADKISYRPNPRALQSIESCNSPSQTALREFLAEARYHCQHWAASLSSQDCLSYLPLQPVQAAQNNADSLNPKQWRTPKICWKKRSKTFMQHSLRQLAAPLHSRIINQKVSVERTLLIARAIPHQENRVDWNTTRIPHQEVHATPLMPFLSSLIAWWVSCKHEQRHPQKLQQHPTIRNAFSCM